MTPRASAKQAAVNAGFRNEHRRPFPATVSRKRHSSGAYFVVGVGSRLPLKSCGQAAQCSEFCGDSHRGPQACRRRRRREKAGWQEDVVKASHWEPGAGGGTAGHRVPAAPSSAARSTGLPRRPWLASTRNADCSSPLPACGPSGSPRVTIWEGHANGYHMRLRIIFILGKENFDQEIITYLF